MGQQASHNEVGRTEKYDDKSHADVVLRLVGISIMNKHSQEELARLRHVQLPKSAINWALEPLLCGDLYVLYQHSMVEFIGFLG